MRDGIVNFVGSLWYGFYYYMIVSFIVWVWVVLELMMLVEVVLYWFFVFRKGKMYFFGLFVFLGL